MNYLSETEALIKHAEKLRADRYAPTSLNNAQLLLEAAETELNENRYDTDKPRSLAVDAKHNALHAIYVASLEKRIRDRETSLEAILLEWEASIMRLGDALDTPVYLTVGRKKPSMRCWQVSKRPRPAKPAWNSNWPIARRNSPH